jgi:hypothetical protein
MTRPVESLSPITHTNFVSSIPQGAIDKVDLLFDIDNSASMADKQEYLSEAIPDLIARLVTPNCLDAMGNPTGDKSTIDGKCPNGATPEFAPVHNMHVGIVSSSLGPRGGDMCKPAPLDLGNGQKIAYDNDDQGHLIDRAASDIMDHTSNPLGAAEPDKFLDWFPGTAANQGATATGPTPVTDPQALQTDFQQMVIGVHQFGCGIESQLESWYRFLVQPDPYASIGLDPSGKFAEWVGVDNVILNQRAQFLRPDSLVVVLVLTDENDSEVDARSYGGQGWNWMRDPPVVPNKPAFGLARGTSACLSNDPATVGSEACRPCGGSATQGDANCQVNGGFYTKALDGSDWGYDPNLRHVHERQKYGVSVQYPVERYVVGLTSPKVPDRNGEYPPAKTPSGYAPSYQGLLPANQACTNPLFAAKLPVPADPSSTDLSSDWANRLCHLSPGTRLPGSIFYAHIGGVPHELLQKRSGNAPPDPDAPQKDTLSEADWTLILGKDPEHYDYSGIDPHMVESYQTRVSTPVPPGGFPVSGTGAAEGTDPISGREWVTDGQTHVYGISVDREYACTFKLPTPRACDANAIANDHTLSNSCDCVMPPGATPVPPENLPAVCNDTTPTQQDYAKAYPTIRELQLARLLGQVQGANPGIVSSLCPIHTTPKKSTDGQPDLLYGYRPAMNAIADRLVNALASQCLPQRLDVSTDPTTGTKSVACLVLGTFPDGPNAPKDCSSVSGYKNPEPDVLARFQAAQHNAWKDVGDTTVTDPSTELTCELEQLPPDTDCSKQDGQQGQEGWCYLSSGTKHCAQELLFSPNALKFGVQTTLQCLEASTNGAAAH